jgi:TRAP-type C4-dicarboxylate transport system permease small subunit
LSKISGWLGKAFIFVAGIALGIVVCLVAGSAIMRYVFGSPFRFTEEIVGLLFAAMAFFSIAYCALCDREIKVDIIYESISKPLQRAGQFIAAIARLIFAVWIGLLVYDFASLSFRIGSRTDMTGIILWPWMSLFAIVVVGIIVSVFYRSSTPRPDVEEEL